MVDSSSLIITGDIDVSHDFFLSELTPIGFSISEGGKQPFRFIYPPYEPLVRLRSKDALSSDGDKAGRFPERTAHVS